MSTPARRDDLLEQIRALPLEDREFIETELIREAYELRRRTASEAELAEIVQRANDAVARPERGLTQAESHARATAVAEAIRSRK